MLKCLIFDLGRVLIPFDFHRGYQGMGLRSGLDPEEVRTRIKALNLVTPYETGLIETREFIDAVKRRLGVQMSDADFGEIWGSIFLAETLLPDSLLEDLRSRYRLVLLSNTNELHYDLVAARYPLLRHFHARVLSYEVKAMKPDARIFEAAIAAAQCRAEECFFTDDIADYVEGAKRMGIDAVQFENEAQIRRDLAARGCLPNGTGGETRGR
jgi:putative hydrolase of the HAD superfamily